MPDAVFVQRPISEISIAIKDGTHGSFKRVGNGIPFLSAKNVTEKGRVEWDDGDDRISKEDYISIMSSFKPITDDLLLTIVGTLGRRALFEEAELAFQRSVAFIRPNTAEIVPRFLFHAVGSSHYYKQLVQRSNATAQAGLYLGELAKTVVSTPQQSEQTRIAYVLDTMDEAIAKAEAVSAKLKQARSGLLHDLLSYGLDGNGQLRDPITHPEQFKDSPLGRIPKGWDVGTVKSLAVNRDAKRIPVKQSDREGHHGLYPYYGASGVIDYINDYIFDGDFVLIGEDGENLRSRQLPLAFIASGKFWVNNHAHILEPFQDTDVRFLATILDVQDFIPWLLGSAQPKLTQRNLEQVPLRIPPPHEQKIISDILATSDVRIETENVALKKIKSLKSGLQDDLLTGRVRVPETIWKELLWHEGTVKGASGYA